MAPLRQQLLKSLKEGVAPYRFSLLASRVGSPEKKTYNKDCNRPFLKHSTQLLNFSAALWWLKMTKI